MEFDEDDPVPRGTKQKRGQKKKSNEDDSVDSDDYNKKVDELRNELGRVDPKQRLLYCYDKRLEIHAKLRESVFLPLPWSIPVGRVESWAYDIKARLDGIHELGKRLEGTDNFQRSIGLAMTHQGTLSCDKMIFYFESKFGIEFSSAIVPLNDEGLVLWVFNSNDDTDPTVHNFALGIRTRLTSGCKESILTGLRDADEKRDHGKLCEVLPRMWLIPGEDATFFMKHATYQATRCSYENALKFKTEARVHILDYCFVDVSLCEYHVVNLL